MTQHSITLAKKNKTPTDDDDDDDNNYDEAEQRIPTAPQWNA